MIVEWLKRKRAAAILKRNERKAAERREREQEIEKETTGWREAHFVGITFPVVILTKKDYLAVSTLAEYYIDPDINIWFIKPDHELVDSIGQKYDFKQIEQQQWVPDKKIGTMDYEELKNRLMPLLYMPNHTKRINGTKTIKDIIELLIT